MDSQKNKATDLIRLAYEAQKRSYSPYSGFQTGAALETAGGKVYQGCNIENAGYTPSNCAVGNYPGKPGDYCAPCGVCRQVMREFCDPETFEIIIARGPEDYKSFLLKELLPESFGPDDLV